VVRVPFMMCRSIGSWSFNINETSRLDHATIFAKCKERRYAMFQNMATP